MMFCFSDFVRSYLPPIGLAAASIDARAFNVAWQQKNNLNRSIKQLLLMIKQVLKIIMFLCLPITFINIKNHIIMTK